MPQENNMAEVVRLLHTIIGKVDGLATDMTELKSDVQVLKTDVQVLKTDVKRLDKGLDRVEMKMDTVIEKVIDNTRRMNSVEDRVEILEKKG